MSTRTEIAPPVAARRHTEKTIHGHTLVDDYAWLRERDNPEVVAYLEAENAYTAAVLEPTAELQKELYAEMLSHIKETDVSVPFRDGQYWYYSRTEEGLQYPIYCRKPGLADAADSNAAEEVILDVNELAKGESFMAVGMSTVSDDGNLLAYSTDNKGFRQYTLHVKDLRTGELLAERVERVGSIVWATNTDPDDRTLFYTVEDEEQKRQYQLYRHVLGTPHSEDVLIYEETDERFNIGAGRTRDHRYIILESASHTTSEEQFLPADKPTGIWRLIQPRQDNVEYYADHRGGLFYIRTNDTGRNFRLVTVPVDTPEQKNWTEILPHRPEVMLEEVDLFASFFIACERWVGLQHLRVFSFSGSGPETSAFREISFPEPVYTAHPHINRVFDTTRFRYSYESLVAPSSVYEYDVITEESTLLKELEIPGGFDRTRYASERLFAKAPDGVEIPVSLVYRKDLRKSGANPLYIYGYGAYGYPLPVSFGSSRLSLLDRGFVVAYAHVRGGGDLGKPWHDAGRLLHKRNTFTDFIAVTEHLLGQGYGDPARVAIEGGSAGGLLMGAVANLRPDLFRAVVSHVPFVDVMNTMLDSSLPLTVPEYEEWGDPNQPDFFKYMLSYSPYDNLEAQDYPAMLVKTSLYDSQVMYWEPAKYVAKLRTLKTDGNSLLLHTNMTAGHGGASGRYDYLKEIAMDYAFLFRELGV
ncbi:MAG: S9 family peptidase [Silvibacterium sp.]|nr:S9 family peptidase [Silvibacterium sp.]